MFLKYDSRGDVVGPTMTGVFAVLTFIALLIIVPMTFETVSPGTVKVGYKFGKYTETITQGMHFPVDPLVSWRTVDTRQKTVQLEDVSLPSQDQLTSVVDVSVQYRAIATAGDTIISGTGDVEAVIQVHLFPKAAELIRDAGRSVPKAEHLYSKEVVTKLASEMTDDLRDFLKPKGILVETVLFRHIELPPFIVTAIQKKKEREQMAEQQKAELERFKTEQQQKVKTAEAEKEAAVLQAERVKVLADAEAYRIKIVNDAIADNPAYIQLQSLEALKQMSKDPASKLIIMDGNSARPIPFLNLGEAFTGNSK